jgi:hypothetical protein
MQRLYSDRPGRAALETELVESGVPRADLYRVAVHGQPKGQDSVFLDLQRNRMDATRVLEDRKILGRHAGLGRNCRSSTTS